MQTDAEVRSALLCVGALTHDNILRFETLPQGAGKFIPIETTSNAGGMAASAATAASRQGARVALWASVGSDALANELINSIEAEGVDCSAVRRVPAARSASATILVDAVGDRMVVVDYDARTQSDPDAFPFPDVSKFDAVLTDVRWPGAAAMALNAARSAGIPAILDADTAPLHVLQRLLPLASHVVASESVIVSLCGMALAADEAVRWLAQRMGVFVAVTCGGAGTFWTDGPLVRHTRAPQIVPVDTLAAGDVFHGCFAFGLAEGWPMERVMQFASAAAALKCLTFGGRLGAPTFAETIAMMKGTAP